MKKPVIAESKEAKPPLVKKSYSRRIYMLMVSGAIACAGLVMFIVYFLSLNMAFGGPSVLMMGGGFFLFKYYWGKTDEIITEHIGQVSKVQVNSMCLYSDKIVFENIKEPDGYPWECLNDKKKYFVLIKDKETDKLIPFVLPDQQYYDPGVFAERVLELPAHQKIFTRKPTLFQKLKTGLLVLAIAIVWILIITTTG